MKKHFFYLSIMLFLIGCKTIYRTSNPILEPSDNIKYIKLNGNYEVYYRDQVKSNPYYYLEKGQENLKAHTEFQYIFFKNDSIIYITTLPSKHFFDRTNRNILNKTSPNLFFFNFFSFGKKNALGNMVFTNDNKKEIWKIDKKNDTIILNSIDNYTAKKISKDTIDYLFDHSSPTEEIFKSKIQFRKLNTFKHISYMNCFEKDCDNEHPKDDSFFVKYIKINYTKKHKIESIEFIFNENFSENYNSYKFKNNRIKFY